MRPLSSSCFASDLGAPSPVSQQCSKLRLTLPLADQWGKIRMKSVNVLAPHEVVGALARAGKCDDALGTLAAVAAFWETFSDQEWCKLHPAHSGGASNCAPLTLHGDGACSYNSKTVYALSFSSLLTHSGRWNTRFLITAIPEKSMVWETFEILLNFLSWSFTFTLKLASTGKRLRDQERRLLGSRWACEQPSWGSLGT